jgi:hypothetical protein
MGREDLAGITKRKRRGGGRKGSTRKYHREGRQIEMHQPPGTPSA